jgi:hypothetical protein
VEAVAVPRLEMTNVMRSSELQEIGDRPRGCRRAAVRAVLLGAAVLVAAGLACGKPPAPAGSASAGDAPAAATPAAATPATGPARADTVAIPASMLVPGPPQRLDGHAFLFTLLAPEAQTVSLVGSFNGWLPSAHPLRREGDLWYGVAEVRPGRHRYKFLVDGAQWVLDSDNERRAGDGVGGLASALNVTT